MDKKSILRYFKEGVNLNNQEFDITCTKLKPYVKENGLNENDLQRIIDSFQQNLSKLCKIQSNTLILTTYISFKAKK